MGKEPTLTPAAWHFLTASFTPGRHGSCNAVENKQKTEVVDQL